MIQWAAIFLSDRILYSTYEPKPQEPHSAVTQLIQGIFEEIPEKALSLLRHHIVVNYKPSILCRGMIAIAAKRFRFEPELDSILKQSSLPLELVHYLGPKLEPLRFLATYQEAASWVCGATKEVETQDKEEAPKYLQDRAVRAVLFNAQNQVLLMAENKNSKNKTKHAEVVLLQDYFRVHQQGFQEETLLMTSLQCCKMCAAMAWHMHVDPLQNLRAIYVMPEKGSSARDTIFTPGGNLRREFYQDKNAILRSVESEMQRTPES